MNAPLYKGSALKGQTVGSRVVACGCGKTYSPEAFAKLPRVGRQDAGDATYLMLANCSCGSTMGMPWCGTDGCVCSTPHAVAPINAENRRARFPCKGCSKLIDPKPPGCLVPRWYCGWECEEKAAGRGAKLPTLEQLKRTIEREIGRGIDDEAWRDE